MRTFDVKSINNMSNGFDKELLLFALRHHFVGDAVCMRFNGDTDVFIDTNGRDVWTGVQGVYDYHYEIIIYARRDNEKVREYKIINLSAMFNDGFDVLCANEVKNWYEDGGIDAVFDNVESAILTQSNADEYMTVEELQTLSRRYDIKYVFTHINKVDKRIDVLVEQARLAAIKFDEDYPF